MQPEVMERADSERGGKKRIEMTTDKCVCVCGRGGKRDCTEK